ncbi:hypothetical protein PINS_up006989 [Pythium insidiosum]|nr:hypothetical protein PINS_up006989 [Pythium insidiosum]
MREATIESDVLTLLEKHGTDAPRDTEGRLEVVSLLASLLEARGQRDCEDGEDEMFFAAHRLTLDMTSPAASRRSIFETLLAGQNALIDEKMEREIQQQRETAEIEALGLEIDATTSRVEIATRLKDLLSLLESMKQAVDDESELLHARGDTEWTIAAPLFSRLEVLNALYQRFDDLRAEQVSVQAMENERQQREWQREREVFAQCEVRILDEEGPVLSVDRRIEIYQGLFKRVQVLQENQMVLQKSIEALKREHDDAVAALHVSALATADTQRQELEKQRRVQLEAAEAEAVAIESTLKQKIETLRCDHEAELQRLRDLHETTLERLRDEHTAAMSAAIAAALEKQAHQLAFRNTLHSAIPSEEKCSNNGHLLEAVSRRDNEAVARIYRLIRLTTDVLNTSTLTPSTISGSGSGEISVELTQAVMACVKELKSLKDYLISSLEELTKRSESGEVVESPEANFWALAVTSSAAAVVSDKETSIDAMLTVHREVMAWLHASHTSQTLTVRRILTEVATSIEEHALGLADGVKPVAMLEMALAAERAEHAALQLQLETKETFTHRLEMAWNAMEATLRRALDDAKREREALQTQLNAVTEQLMAQSLLTSPPMTSHTTGGAPRTPSLSSNAAPSAVAAVPTRPDKPRGYSRSGFGSASAAGASGSAHKERFVSDLEKETGQRRSSTAMRRAQEWKRHEILSSSLQLEREFRAATSQEPDRLELSSALDSPRSSQSSAGAPPGTASLLQDSELWYQGVRTLQHVQFFISAFFVARQNMFRIEAFNSDTEQAQTIYVTLDEMTRFMRESRRAAKLGLSLEDPTKRSEVIDVVLFGRVKVLGGGGGSEDGASSNVLLAFE